MYTVKVNPKIHSQVHKKDEFLKTKFILSFRYHWITIITYIISTYYLSVETKVTQIPETTLDVATNQF